MRGALREGDQRHGDEAGEALRGAGPARGGRVGEVPVVRLALLRGGAPGEPRPAAQQEGWAAWYLQQPYSRPRCRELAERLEQAESQETARKRQKLEEETAERRRLEAELQKSQQEERRALRNRLAAAEAQVSGKDAELQTLQSESAKCKERCEELTTCAAAAESAVEEMRKELRQLQGEHGKCQSESAGLKEQCEELATRAAAAESAVEEMRKELRQLQGEHGKCQERCQELANRLEEAEAEAPSDASEKQVEVQQLKEERCSQHAEAQPASAEEAGSMIKAVLQERCEQLRQQLKQTSAKAEVERSAMLGQMQVLWEEKGTYKERCRQLEHQLCEAKKQEQESPHSNSQHGHHSISASRAASSEQEADLAELFGYSFVDVVDEDRASILSGSSQSSINQNCFMLDSMFKVRLDVIREGRDLHKGSQVVAADGRTVVEVVEIKEAQATEVVDLLVGTDMLRVTPDHRVQVPDESGEVGRRFYREAGKLKQGDLVMIAPGKPVALTGAETHPMECKVLKIVFKPDLPVPVFTSPTCILSKGHEKKSRGGRRGGMCQRGKEASDPTDGASIPDTAAGEYTD